MAPAPKSPPHPDRFHGLLPLAVIAAYAFAAVISLATGDTRKWLSFGIASAGGILVVLAFLPRLPRRDIVGVLGAGTVTFGFVLGATDMRGSTDALVSAALIGGGAVACLALIAWLLYLAIVKSKPTSPSAPAAPSPSPPSPDQSTS